MKIDWNRVWLQLALNIYLKFVSYDYYIQKYTKLVSKIVI